MSPGEQGAESSATTRCGVTECVVFVLALACGTACSICSKTMMQLRGEGITGEIESFEKPLFQTFGMFVGMCFGLVMHWFVLFFKINFPGYDHSPQVSATVMPIKPKGSILPNKAKGLSERDRMLPPRGASEKDSLLPRISSGSVLQNNESGSDNNNSTPLWMYFFLAIPSIFDLLATALCMMGLRYLDVSVYQLLRGSGIIFVALMKQHVLGDKLYRFQWIGVSWNVVSVALVGGSAILAESHAGGDDGDVTDNAGLALLGSLLVLCGAFVQALQFVFEEKVMNMDDVAVPPLLLIGMEGVWGTFFCMAILYPIAYFLPGNDHGSYEDPFNTWYMVTQDSTIRWAFIVYFFVILGYNVFAVLVTFLLNSVWHAILDNFRPLSIWLVDLAIYYLIAHGTGDFGEPWRAPYSYVQVVGMAVLLYGTAIYNVPNAGSIRLLGQWWNSFGVDLSKEYDMLEVEMEEKAVDFEWEQRQRDFKHRRPSSMAERSPMVSVHTQALRGVATNI